MYLGCTILDERFDKLDVVGTEPREATDRKLAANIGATSAAFESSHDQFFAANGTLARLGAFLQFLLNLGKDCITNINLCQYVTNI